MASFFAASFATPFAEVHKFVNRGGVLGSRQIDVIIEVSKASDVIRELNFQIDPPLSKPLCRPQRNDLAAEHTPDRLLARGKFS